VWSLPKRRIAAFLILLSSVIKFKFDKIEGTSLSSAVCEIRLAVWGFQAVFLMVISQWSFGGHWSLMVIDCN